MAGRGRGRGIIQRQVNYVKPGGIQQAAGVTKTSSNDAPSSVLVNGDKEWSNSSNNSNTWSSNSNDSGQSSSNVWTDKGTTTSTPSSSNKSWSSSNGNWTSSQVNQQPSSNTSGNNVNLTTAQSYNNTSSNTQLTNTNNSSSYYNTNVNHTSNTVTIQDITSGLHNLGIQSQDDDFKEFAKTAKTFATNSEQLTELVTLLYKRSLSDPDYGEAMAKTVRELWAFDVDGLTFRKILLSFIKDDSNNKEEMRSTCEDRLTAFMSFLCQMFAHVQSNIGPFKVFVKPILQCVMMILVDGGETQVETCAQQLHVVGSLLDRQTPEEIDTMFDLIRTRILSRKSSTRMRCVLMELLEMRNNKWRIPESVAKFYMNFTDDGEPDES